MSKGFDVRIVKELARDVKQNYVTQLELAKQEKGSELNFKEKVELRQTIENSVSQQKFVQKFESLSDTEFLNNIVFCICEKSTINRKPLYYGCLEGRIIGYIFWSGKNWVLDDSEDFSAPYRVILSSDPFSPLGSYNTNIGGNLIEFQLIETDKESQCQSEPVGNYPEYISVTGFNGMEKSFLGNLTRSDIIVQSIGDYPTNINGVPYYGGTSSQSESGNLFLYYGDKGWTYDSDTEEPGIFGFSDDQLNILGSYSISSLSESAYLLIEAAESGTLPESVDPPELVTTIPLVRQVSYTWNEQSENTNFLYTDGLLQLGSILYFDNSLEKQVSSQSYSDYKSDGMQLLTSFSSQEIVFNPETGLLDSTTIQISANDSGEVVNLINYPSLGSSTQISIDGLMGSYVMIGAEANPELYFTMSLSSLPVSDWGSAFSESTTPDTISINPIRFKVTGFNYVTEPPVSWSADELTFSVEQQAVQGSNNIFIVIDGELRTFSIVDISLSVNSNNGIDTNGNIDPSLWNFPQSGVLNSVSGSITISNVLLKPR